MVQKKYMISPETEHKKPFWLYFNKNALRIFLFFKVEALGGGGGGGLL
jgi:hypothetical protein